MKVKAYAKRLYLELDENGYQRYTSARKIALECSKKVQKCDTKDDFFLNTVHVLES